jgi:2-polyprenyl-6-methoxyphenol hydroxylase-like FAD-dependent oxidoreductase
LVGLSAAVFLAVRGVRVTLVERHVGSHAHPRAVGYTARTQELYDAIGLADALPDVPRGFRLRRARVDSLAGRWNEGQEWTPPKAGTPPPTAEYSPHVGAFIAQDRLEPALRTRAQELGVDLRLGTELVRLSQDADRVTGWLRPRGDGDAYASRFQYVIAADGSRSPVREALGIGRRGPGMLQIVRSVLFRAALNEYLTSEIRQFEIHLPDLRAFLTTYGDDRWVLMFLDDVERDEAAQRAAIVRAIGRDDVPVEIVVTGQWELSGLVADRFFEGRAFLAGDAAHTLPPTRGGYGANTGIADAHNLAWKMAAVIAGQSSPSLLDTYDAERRPVAWTRLEQTFARPDYAQYGGEFAGLPLLEEAAIEFGQLYRSEGILGVGSDLPVAALPDVWAGQPGTRAPHVWITREGQRRSTLDLFQRGWVLITADGRWTGAAADLDIEVQVFSGEEAASVSSAFGLGVEGAALVRPDGVVAWRVATWPEDQLETLRSAFRRASFARRA